MNVPHSQSFLYTSLAINPTRQTLPILVEVCKHPHCLRGQKHVYFLHDNMPLFEVVACNVAPAGHLGGGGHLVAGSVGFAGVGKLADARPLTASMAKTAREVRVFMIMMLDGKVSSFRRSVKKEGVWVSCFVCAVVSVNRKKERRSDTILIAKPRFYAMK